MALEMCPIAWVQPMPLLFPALTGFLQLPRITVPGFRPAFPLFVSINLLHSILAPLILMAIHWYITCVMHMVGAALKTHPFLHPHRHHMVFQVTSMDIREALH